MHNVKKFENEGVDNANKNIAEEYVNPVSTEAMHNLKAFMSSEKHVDEYRGQGGREDRTVYNVHGVAQNSSGFDRGVRVWGSGIVKMKWEDFTYWFIDSLTDHIINPNQKTEQNDQEKEVDNSRGYRTSHASGHSESFCIY